MKHGKGDESAVTRQVNDVVRDVARFGWAVAATPGAPHDPKDPAAGCWPPGHYVDNDVRISRGHPKKSQFHRLLADVRAGAITAVAATQGDRLWRNRAETAETLDLFEDLGIWVMVNGQPYNCKDPSHVAMLEQLGVFSRLEVARMGQRIDRAAYDRAKAGKISNGPVPFGNKPVWSDDTPRKFLGWQPDPESWDRMRVAAKEVMQGVLSRAEIARRLNADGYRTARGGEWDGDTLRQYLLSPWIRGVVTYTGAVPDGEPPFTEVPGTNFRALVPDLDEWAMLRLALGTGPDRGSHRKRDDPQHLLTGFAYCGRVLDASDGRGECGICGHHLTLTNGGKLHNHNPSHSGFYDRSGERCPGSGADPLRAFPHEREGETCRGVLTNRRGTANGQPVYCCPAWPRGCGKLARNEAETDRWVTVNLFHWLAPNGAYDRAIATAHAEDPAVSSLQDEQVRDKALLPALLDKLGDGLISDEEYADQKARIQARISDRQAVIDRKASRQRAAVITERGADLAAAWGKWGLARQRTVLGMFLHRVDVLPCRQGPIPFDPSKVIVTPLAAWAGDAPAGSLAVPDAAASFTDPRKDRNRNPVPARDRILNWLHANPGSDLTAVDIMDYGLADSRDVKSARLLLWRMDQAGEIAVTIRGVRGRTANHYGLPARS